MDTSDLSDFGQDGGYDPDAFVDSSAYSGLSGISDNESHQSTIPNVPENCVAVDMPNSTEFVQIGDEMTYAEIKAALLEAKASEGLTALELYDVNDKPLADEDLVANSVGQHIRAKVPSAKFPLLIQDLRKTHQIDKSESHMTIKTIQDILEEEKHVRLTILSFKGTMVTPDQTLQDLQFNRQSPGLVARIEITIQDYDCDTVEKVHAYDFWPLGELLKTYCEQQRREPHESAILKHQDRSELIETSTTATLYDLGIQNDSQLIYKVPPFPVNIKDSEDIAQNPDGITLEIQDKWTIEEVLTAYSRESTKPFMDGDKILLLGNILDPSIPVWRLRIARNQELMIEREIQAKALPYLCSECGHTVLLKGADTVSCRGCFAKILYKTRTTRACQYDCR